MKIAMADDDVQDLRRLSEMISRALSLLGHSDNLIDTFQSAEELFSVWTPGRYELILLDIYMHGMDGIDAARRIREQDENVMLVFCTSSNSFACESYEVSAAYYLCKPISWDGILKMLEKLDVSDCEASRFVTLPDGKHLLLRNILYTEYHNHIVTIHNKKGDAVRTRISQLEFQNLLCAYPCFHCCHKGIIVNFYEITDLHENVITLSSGETLYISRRREKEMQNAFEKFIFEQMKRELRR